MGDIGRDRLVEGSSNSGQIRRDVTANLIGAVFFVSSTVAAVLVTKWLLNENNVRYIRMRCASNIQRYAHNKADYWRVVADRAGTYYNEMRNINV